VTPSDTLHARVAAFVDGGDDDFDALALAVAAHQVARSSAIARLYAARGLDVRALSSAAELPAVPTDAFKLARVAAHPASEDVRIFHTSGTTLGARGQHAFRRLDTYDHAALVHGGRMLVPDAGAISLHAALLMPEGATDSSLGHMCASFARTFAREAAWLLDERGVSVAGLRASADRASSSGACLLVLATSFALVHLLDALDGAVIPLPPGSRIMQTGGFKGKSREVDASELRATVARTFAVDPRAVVSEYGMTELSSQAWEGTVRAWLGRDGGTEAGVLVPPRWMRVVPVDPETLAPVAPGERGIARIVDLANVDSAVVVQTQDAVTLVEGGFRLHGRLPGANPRGCSIAIDELLGGTS
jgi:hypothetical protein